MVNKINATEPLADTMERIGRSIAAKKRRNRSPRPKFYNSLYRLKKIPAPFQIPLARGSLFAAVKDRQYFKHSVTVGEVDGVKIEFAGEQLNQDDHDTFLQLVAMANHKAFGGDIYQAVNGVLRGIGRATHQEQRRQLFDQVSRLVRGTVRLTTPQIRYEGHLLDDASTPLDQATLPQFRRHLAYRLNPKFARLYAESAYTLFDLQERGKLKGRGSEGSVALIFELTIHSGYFLGRTTMGCG